MKRVVSFGEILLRLAAPGYTRLFQKDSLEATFCGGEANVAVSLSLFGLDSVFVTKLPKNDVGIAIIVECPFNAKIVNGNESLT